ncbi:hypothetical protein Gotur_034084 [Gossypium turneri]
MEISFYCKYKIPVRKISNTRTELEQKKRNRTRLQGVYQATIFKVISAPTYIRCANEFQAN